jgi:hypothetical protein
VSSAWSGAGLLRPRRRSPRAFVVLRSPVRRELLILTVVHRHDLARGASAILRRARDVRGPLILAETRAIGGRSLLARADANLQHDATSPIDPLRMSANGELAEGLLVAALGRSRDWLSSTRYSPSNLHKAAVHRRACGHSTPWFIGTRDCVREGRTRVHSALRHAHAQARNRPVDERTHFCRQQPRMGVDHMDR